MRLTILDGFRGFFLIFMMIVHINMQFHAVIGKFNHHTFGWVEDAQGFVFISGFVVGLVYGARLIRSGFEACRKAVLLRIRTIYSHQASLTLIFLAAALIAVGVGYTLKPQTYLAPFVEHPVEMTLSSLLLVSGTLNMGILPMYIWFMFATPFVLRLLHDGRGKVVIALIACAWLLAQTDVVGFAIGGIEEMLEAAGHPVQISIFFNLLGWQVVFFSGLYFGYLQAAGRLDLSFLRDPDWYTIFRIGAVMFVFLGVLDRIVWGNLFGAAFSEWFLTREERRDFTGLYLLSFALDLFLVTWLLVAGRECGNRLVAALSRLVEWVFTRRFLVFLGQHSLHVFSAHLLITYGVNLLVQGRQFGALTENLIVALSPLPLYLAAWGHAWLLDREKRQKAAGRAAAMSHSS